MTITCNDISKSNRAGGSAALTAQNMMQQILSYTYTRPNSSLLGGGLHAGPSQLLADRPLRFKNHLRLFSPSLTKPWLPKVKHRYFSATWRSPPHVALTVLCAAVGVPIKLIHEAEGHIVTIELKNGEIYRGLLQESEDTMNCKLNEGNFLKLCILLLVTRACCSYNDR